MRQTVSRLRSIIDPAGRSAGRSTGHKGPNNNLCCSAWTTPNVAYSRTQRNNALRDSPVPVAHRFRLLVPLLLFPLTFVFGLTLLFATQAQPVAAFPAAQQADLPPAGFVPDGGSVRPPTTDTLAPALTVPGASEEPWVAVVQADRVQVTKYVNGTDSWAQQGGFLNRESTNAASDPAIALGGNTGNTPWVAWREDVGGVGRINASFYNGTIWNLTPIVNRNPNQSANAPAMATDTAIGSGARPWIVWAEENSAGVAQIYVSHAEPDAGQQGGFAWSAAGGSLNFSSTQSAENPDIAMVGIADSVPWVAWNEPNSSGVEQLFVKRWNGTTWDAVGRQEGCANAAECTLNVDRTQHAGEAQIVSGALPNGPIVPWLIFTENNSVGQPAIYVLRLDPGAANTDADDRFVPVGGAVNAQCLGNAGLSSAAANNVDLQSEGLRNAGAPDASTAVSGGSASTPDIDFVGNVPHITWVEGSAGRQVLHVCHLAVAESGLERWDLDSFDGVNRSSAAAGAPSLSTNGTTPYVAWQEALTDTVVYVSHREPLSDAWALNFPAVVNDVAGTPLTIAEQNAMAARWQQIAPADATQSNTPFLRSVGVAVTTAAYHRAGSEYLEEIQFQLTSSSAPTGTAVFLARYVISENLIYVQDPENPGNFFTPVTPGGTTNVNSPVVTLETSDVVVNAHDPSSAAFDIRWSLIFEDATFFNHYIQSVNVIYSGGQATGFHEVGTVYVGSQTYLPFTLRETAAGQ